MLCRQVNYLNEKDANLPQTLTDLENRLITALNIKVNNVVSQFSLMLSDEVGNLSALVTAKTEMLESKTSSLTRIMASLLTTASALKVQQAQLQTNGETRGMEIMRQVEHLNNTTEGLRQQQEKLNSLKREHGLVIKSIRAHACSCTKVFTLICAQAANFV